MNLELAHDMSTDAFLLALRRVGSIRAFAKVLRSSNGLNFIGVERTLKEALKRLKYEKIISVMSRQNISRMGGTLESLLKTIKRTLRVITPDQNFSEDPLTTLLCEVESVIKLRSLTPDSDSIDDFDAITPNQFLLASLLSILPYGNFKQPDLTYRIKWKNV